MSLVRPVLILLMLSITRSAGYAQTEAILKKAFEGRTVIVRIAMPGTEDGIDVYPEESPTLDYPRYADRLKDNGTAIKSGESAMVTKVKVKSKLIEFQLAGGGYGTMGDETSSDVGVASAPKTTREKNLEAELRRETDPAKKRAMNEELDDLRKDREREDARNRASVSEAKETKKQTIRQRRLEGGSRFNIRYRSNVPATALTPDALRRSLAEYVSFEPEAREPSPLQPASPPSGSPGDAGLPRKGMLLADADTKLGSPLKTSSRMEGKLKVVTRVYSVPAGEVTADFVEGVLFRYTVSSR
jgi:hypothetical protein